MRLSNVKLIPGMELVDIAINAEMISSVSVHSNKIASHEPTIHFQNAIALPGLINSHDHLDFNCFPKLGDGGYKNYTEWGADIHKRYKEEINAVLKIPVFLRTEWGIYKNLLSGVTTVINHGEKLKMNDPHITVLQEFQDLHSVAFQKNWKWKLNDPFKWKQFCVIHLGEGTDEKAATEIDELLRWNLFGRKLIGIHGVALNASQAKKIKALVWCPDSNQFLLNAMPDINNLKKQTAILFGTDSTLTGNWSIWQQLRLARDAQQATDEELFDMVSKTPAKTWGLNNGEITAGKQADIVIAKAGSGDRMWDEFYKTDPEDMLMVICKGVIKLFDGSMLSQLKQAGLSTEGFSSVDLNGCIKYIKGDLPALMNAIKDHYPKAVFPCIPCNSEPHTSHA